MDKFHRLVQNDMSTAVIWTKSKPDVEFQFGGRLGDYSMACHPRATCRIAGCCHLANSSAPLKIVFRHVLFFVFLNAVWALMSSGFHIVSDTLVYKCRYEKSQNVSQLSRARIYI